MGRNLPAAGVVEELRCTVEPCRDQTVPTIMENVCYSIVHRCSGHLGA